MLHAVALARFALVTARGWCANSPLARARLAAENDQLKSEVAMLREEIRIKDARLVRLPAARRPHFPPPERLAILTLRTARGWNAEQAARRFQLTGATIATWMRRLDEQGEAALVRTPVPINRFPDFARDLVVRLRTTLPAIGTQRIADTLARAGLHLAKTTVRRIAKERRPPSGPPAPATVKPPSGRTVTAKHPNHVHNVDLTIVPTVGGFWVPWLPQAIAQCWPFCWCPVAPTRLGFASPTSPNAVLGPLALRAAGGGSRLASRLVRPIREVNRTVAPQITAPHHGRCPAAPICPRFGAVGRYGSIAVLERFMRTLKAEGLRRLLTIPLAQARMTEELTVLIDWYNELRPHRTLGGATPNELYFGRPLARDALRFEVRGPYPTRDTKLRAEAGTVVELHVERYRGRAHLPVIELRQAA